MAKRLCFILMPFGKKDDATGRTIDFDRIYAEIIKPGVEAAGLECVRADHEPRGGVIHKAMLERLALCDFAVADLTTANANVFYELGVRHAARSQSTVLIRATGQTLPFDLGPMRTLKYDLDASGAPTQAVSDGAQLKAALQACHEPGDDSPFFQLVNGWPRPSLDHLRTEAFLEKAERSETRRAQLAHAREEGQAAVRALGDRLDLATEEPGVLIDLLISYRSVGAFDAMCALVERLPKEVKQTVIVQEQYGFGLNREGRWREAEAVLLAVIARIGPNPETNGLLGRVYKDRWEQAEKAGDPALAAGWLARAIKAYAAGFDADIRDAYPGVNAVTLMEIEGKSRARQQRMLPVVAYAVRRRLADDHSDYWDHATLLELHVLAGEAEEANDQLTAALALADEGFKPESTARNLGLIAKARRARGETIDGWLDSIIQALEARHAALTGGAAGWG